MGRRAWRNWARGSSTVAIDGCSGRPACGRDRRLCRRHHNRRGSRHRLQRRRHHGSRHRRHHRHHRHLHHHRIGVASACCSGCTSRDAQSSSCHICCHDAIGQVQVSHPIDRSSSSSSSEVLSDVRRIGAHPIALTAAATASATSTSTVTAATTRSTAASAAIVRLRRVAAVARVAERKVVVAARGAHPLGAAATAAAAAASTAAASAIATATAGSSSHARWLAHAGGVDSSRRQTIPFVGLASRNLDRQNVGGVLPERLLCERATTTKTTKTTKTTTQMSHIHTHRGCSRMDRSEALEGAYG